MLDIIIHFNQIVWGAPALILILGVGIYLTFRTGFLQIRLLPSAIAGFFGLTRNSTNEDGSSFRAVCTALAATVGTGNLAGVAGAIALGGPGALFWMWICALLGMIIKCAEATLAVYYSKSNLNGEKVGGTMYMIEYGLGKRFRWLACIYSFLGAVAAFGVGNATQINTVITGIENMSKSWGWHFDLKIALLIGFVMAIFLTIMLLGGARRIGDAAQYMIPFASVLYIALSLFVLIRNYSIVPNAFSAIFRGALTPKAVTGGVTGSAMIALRIGAARGVFSNEAGMGTATVAHAGAKVAHPLEQGLMGIVEVFIDTIVICTLTGLVILCSGIGIPYGTDPGVGLTLDAFTQVFGRWVIVPLTLALCLFAVATFLGWGLYGIRYVEYLLGEKSRVYFILLQGCIVVFGALTKTGTVWVLSEITNGLMVIPNLIALLFLSPVLLRLVREYKMGTR